jgi:hypothetical protein
MQSVHNLLKIIEILSAAKYLQKGGAEPTLYIDNYLVFKFIQKRFMHKFRYEGFLMIKRVV